MAWRIATELVDRIVAEAAASPGVEVCGLLLGEADPPLPFALSLSKHERGRGGTITQIRPCRNVAVDLAHRFEIDPAVLLLAHRQARAGGPAILGCYHSHPSGRAEPSARDAADAEPNGWLWLIVAGREARGWRAVAGGTWHGRFDPVSFSC